MNLDYDKYRQALYDTYQTIPGKKVIDFLEDQYVNASAFKPDANETMYVLGQKELIQQLIFDIKNFKPQEEI